jgi:hypothetical protein
MLVECNKILPRPSGRGSKNFLINLALAQNDLNVAEADAALTSFVRDVNVVAINRLALRNISYICSQFTIRNPQFTYPLLP